jgi:hypothetical protein
MGAGWQCRHQAVRCSWQQTFARTAQLSHAHVVQHDVVPHAMRGMPQSLLLWT